MEPSSTVVSVNHLTAPVAKRTVLVSLSGAVGKNQENSLLNFNSPRTWNQTVGAGG